MLKALGDQFDFLAYYPDFRVDNQEAGTPSNGPLGGGPNGGAVTGIGAQQRGLASDCTAGRFQWQFIQPVYVGTNQMQERPPPGDADDQQAQHRLLHAPARRAHARRPDSGLRLRACRRSGMRWAIAGRRSSRPRSTAKRSRSGRRIGHGPAGAGGVSVSAADGSVGDGRRRLAGQLRRHVHAARRRLLCAGDRLLVSRSVSDGTDRASEVPDFFILRNLAPAGRDANGHPIFKADRTKMTIQDVIAAEGPRAARRRHAQKHSTPAWWWCVRARQAAEPRADRTDEWDPRSAGWTTGTTTTGIAPR